MGGKAAMLLVLAFSLIFLVFGQNFNSLSNRSIENFETYYSGTMAHNIAVAGANLAANRIFIDKTWDAGYEDLNYQDGIINVYVTNPSGTSAKVKVCHNTDLTSEHTISINPSAIPAHVGHGDYLGECGTPAASNMVVIFSEGIFANDTASVYVELQPSNYAKYGNFYDKMWAMPATGDTFRGPFHVNDFMSTYGSPVFFGKVTSKKSLKLYGTKNPEFHGGYTSGVEEDRPWNDAYLSAAAVSGGHVFKDTTGAGRKIDVEIEFMSSGKVEYRINIDGTGWSAKKSKDKIKDLAPNGMIYVEKGDVFVKGTVVGAATVVATKYNNSKGGNIIQTDDLKYKTSPETDPNSKDMLGLVAQKDIRLQYNADTKHADIITQASMYAQEGTVGPDDNLIKNDGILNSWKILGGIIASDTRVTAYYDGSGKPYKGYRFVHTYDERFLTAVPPYFPHTQQYEVVSWYE